MSTEPITLYIDYISQPSRAVLNVIEFGQIPGIAIKEVLIMNMEQRDDEFAKINPNLKLPALKDGELVLCESGAIMRYLCAKFLPEDHFLYPRSCPFRKSIVETYLTKYHQIIRPSARLIYGTFIAPLTNASHLFDLKVEHDRAVHICEEGNKWFTSSTGPFLLGAKPSLADLLIYNEIIQLHSVPGFTLQDKNAPRIVNLLKALWNDPKIKGSNQKLKEFIANSGNDVSYLSN